MRANQSSIFFFHTPRLRRKSTMRRCFYHTNFVQNAVLHNFSRQIAFIQYSGPSKHAWTFNKRNHSKNFQNHPYGQPVLTFEKRQICEEILKELRFNVIKNLLSLFFINGFITMCNLKKRLTRHFEYSCKGCFWRPKNKRQSDENYTFETTNNQ